MSVDNPDTPIVEQKPSDLEQLKWMCKQLAIRIIEGELGEGKASTAFKLAVAIFCLTSDPIERYGFLHALDGGAYIQGEATKSVVDYYDDFCVQLKHDAEKHAGIHTGGYAQ